MHFQKSMNVQMVVIHAIETQRPAIIHQEVTDVSVNKDIIKTMATNVQVMNNESVSLVLQYMSCN